MRIIFTFLFCICLNFANGQDYKSSLKLQDVLKSAPTGYTVLDTATGDLNRDGIKDLIVIYKKINEAETSDVIDHPEKRPLLIYIGAQVNTYKLTAKNENAVYCFDCGGAFGDPYQGITIKNGYFTIEHYGGSSWRWTRFVTFKYSPKDSKWYLHKDGGVYFHTASEQTDDIPEKVRTTKDFGVIPFEIFDIFKEQE